MTPMIDYALGYARRGWKVFPLAVRDKVPLIKGGNGCLDATTDEEQIKKWWSSTPAANIGLATGHSFFVVDIDPKHNGHTWEESVDLPDTIIQQTGSGGRHYLYSGPPTIPNSSSKIATGVDIRGASGYIVAPPSVHPNGKRYVWVDTDFIPTEDPQMAPGWLLDVAGEKKQNGLPPIGETIPHGQQHETLWKYACSLWGGKVKYSEDEVFAAVLILSKRCEQVPPEKNVEKIVHSVTRKHPQGLSPEYAAKAKQYVGQAPQPAVETAEAPEQLGVDLEVADAIARDDMAAIWNMLQTLAAMPVAEYQINRAAIKAHFKTKMSLSALDEAVEALKPADTNVKSSSKSLDPWEEGLHRSEKGKPMPVLINADMALRNHPQWSGVLAFDEFKQKIRVVKQPPIGGKWPRDWTDSDDTNTAVWMQANGIYVGRDIVSSAVQSVAATNQIHVVREYLNGLQWDGAPRIQTWLPRYLKTENTPVIRMIGERWLISAIARIMNPGCKCDYMMVLEGTQGLKKSTALKTLAGSEWFCDHSPDLHDKDAQMQLQGAWIIEWAELDSLRKSEVTAVKNFLSRQNEKFRPPYGRYVIEVPRQCVFAGTTNEFLWQKDDTGGRRFWPAGCGVIGLDALARDRDQLWAEALVRFTDGAIWWPETKEEHEMLSIEQKARMDTDLWTPKIDKFLTEECLGDEKITVNEVIERCLKLSISGCSHGDKIRVGKVMSYLGWQYDQQRVKGTKKHFNGYIRPERMD